MCRPALKKLLVKYKIRKFSALNHTFSAFWLRSSVVSVLISLISGTRTKCSPDD